MAYYQRESDYSTNARGGLTHLINMIRKSPCPTCLSPQERAYQGAIERASQRD